MAKIVGVVDHCIIKYTMVGHKTPDFGFGVATAISAPLQPRSNFTVEPIRSPLKRWHRGRF